MCTLLRNRAEEGDVYRMQVQTPVTRCDCADLWAISSRPCSRQMMLETPLHKLMDRGLPVRRLLNLRVDASFSRSALLG